MDKQTTIAFILIGAILVLWLYISAPPPKQPLKEKEKSSLVKDSLKTKAKDSVLVSNNTKSIKDTVSEFPEFNRKRNFS
jgi:hypothetical protein